MGGTLIPNDEIGARGLAGDRMVEGHRGTGGFQPPQGETSWLSIAAWQEWANELLWSGSNFFYGMMHGVLFGRPEEKVVDGRAVRIQTPGLFPRDWNTASARGQNAVLLGSVGWLYYGPTFASSIIEGLLHEIKGTFWDLPWAIYDGSLFQALKLGMDALFADANTAFFFGRDMGADMIRELGNAAEGPLKGLVAAMGKLMGSLLPDIVGAILTGGGSLVLRGGMKFASQTAKLAPEILEYLAKRAARNGRDLGKRLERAAATREAIPPGSIDRPKIELPKTVTPLGEAPDPRVNTRLGDGDDVRGTGVGAAGGAPARVGTLQRNRPPDDLPDASLLTHQANLAARRMKWLDDAIAKHGVVFDPDILDFVKTVYLSHRKLDLDKDTINEIAALAKTKRDGDLMASRAAQGELDTLKFLDDDALVEGIRMIRQTTETRTPDFEVLYRSGPNAGEIRQIEVRTVTRTGWSNGSRIDKLTVALREFAARLAAYSKLRRSRMPKVLDDRPTLGSDGKWKQSEYLYKTQVYDRGSVSVQIVGDLGDALPLSPTEIALLKQALIRYAPTDLVDAKGAKRALEVGELANIDSVWVHYVGNGNRKVQVVEIPPPPTLQP